MPTPLPGPGSKNEYAPDPPAEHRHSWTLRHRLYDVEMGDWWSFLCTGCGEMFGVEIDPEMPWFMEPLEWVEPNPSLPPAEHRGGEEETVWLCAKCGYGSEEHGMHLHPAHLCVADMRLVPAAFRLSADLETAERKQAELREALERAKGDFNRITYRLDAIDCPIRRYSQDGAERVIAALADPEEQASA